jgi:hypothetical protein
VPFSDLTAIPEARTLISEAPGSQVRFEGISICFAIWLLPDDLLSACWEAADSSRSPGQILQTVDDLMRQRPTLMKIIPPMIRNATRMGTKIPTISFSCNPSLFIRCPTGVIIL